jgi:hypothetical protein
MKYVPRACPSRAPVFAFLLVSCALSVASARLLNRPTVPAHTAVAAAASKAVAAPAAPISTLLGEARALEQALILAQAPAVGANANATAGANATATAGTIANGTAQAKATANATAPAPQPAAPPHQPATRTAAINPHRGCFTLAPNEAVVVRAVGQRFGNGTFLLAGSERMPEPTHEQAAMHALLEALMGDCTDNATGSPAWVVDAGTSGSAATALAASLGCSVAAFDPESADVQALETTRCVNAPAQPFAVFSALASNATFAGPPLKELGGRKQAQALLTQALASTAWRGHGSPAGAVPSFGASPKGGGVAAAGVASNRTLAANVALDSVFLKGSPPPVVGATSLAAAMGGAGSLLNAKGAVPNFSHGSISLLKVTPHRCCGQGAALAALSGARGLLKSGRVRCLATEMAFDTAITPHLLGFFKELEQMGYALLQAGPLDLPGLEVADNGAYPLFKTDVKQLNDLFGTFLKIQRFDERSGYRIYGDGLSLDRDGRYFDYTNFVVACKGQVPHRVPVREKGRVRFRDGTWWPEQQPKKDEQHHGAAAKTAEGAPTAKK